MLQNASNYTIHFFCRGSMPPKPLANAWLRHASQAALHMQLAQPPKGWPPLANPEYAHGLLLRNLFEEMRS